jgi:hypothetical protein
MLRGGHATASLPSRAIHGACCTTVSARLGGRREPPASARSIAALAPTWIRQSEPGRRSSPARLCHTTMPTAIRSRVARSSAGSCGRHRNLQIRNAPSRDGQPPRTRAPSRGWRASPCASSHGGRATRGRARCARTYGIRIEALFHLRWKTGGDGPAFRSMSDPGELPASPLQANNRQMRGETSW